MSNVSTNLKILRHDLIPNYSTLPAHHRALCKIMVQMNCNIVIMPTDEQTDLFRSFTNSKLVNLRSSILLGGHGSQLSPMFRGA